MQQHSFIKAALQGDNSFWAYLGSIAIVLTCTIGLGGIPFAVLAAYSDDPNAAFAMDFATAGISPALGFALMLLIFTFGLLGLWLGVKLLHRRSFYSLVNNNNWINWKKVWTGAGIWFALLVIVEIINYILYPEIYQWTFNAAQFFPILIVTLIFIPLQSSFEEFLFRGYLMQGIGTAFRYPIIALLITSIVFGAMHLGNPEISKYGTWLIWSYVQIGLMLGIVTLMDEGLELALGVHAMNNIYASIFVTFPSSALAMPTMITMTEFNAELVYIYSTISEILFIIICVWLYKWSDWSKLFKKIVLKKVVQNENSILLGDKDLDDLGL